MSVKQFEIWLADLNPQKGTEPGKVRPVVVVQTDLLNEYHPSTIICPVTTNVKDNIEILRIHLLKNQLEQLSDILVDQIRAIDNRRFIKKLGHLTGNQKKLLKKNLRIILEL
jgi:mRNA interferase MazF